jgi:hypothetical protein
MESYTSTSTPPQSHSSSEHIEPSAPQGFKITGEDAELLKEYLDDFQDGKADVRTKIIENAMADLVAIRPDNEPFNKGEASKVIFACMISLIGPAYNNLQKIRKWFYNHYVQPERQYVKFIRRWSTRNAFYHMCCDEVTAEAEEMSGAPPGSRAFLGSLQDATTKLWKRLSDQDQQIYVRLANKWSDESPPPHIQARCVMPTLFLFV